MMTVANMLGNALRSANKKIAKEASKKELQYEYKANVNHAVGVLKDRLILMVAEEDSLVRDHLWRELVGEIKHRVILIRPNREVPRKGSLPKPHFHHNHKSSC